MDFQDVQTCGFPIWKTDLVLGVDDVGEVELSFRRQVLIETEPLDRFLPGIYLVEDRRAFSIRGLCVVKLNVIDDLKSLSKAVKLSEARQAS